SFSSPLSHLGSGACTLFHQRHSRTGRHVAIIPRRRLRNMLVFSLLVRNCCLLVRRGRRITMGTMLWIFNKGFIYAEKNKAACLSHCWSFRFRGGNFRLWCSRI